MKKLFALLLLSGVALNLCAQQHITLDFNTMDFSVPISVKKTTSKSVKKDKYYILEIQNINLNNYTVNINIPDSQIKTDIEMPAFKGFDLGLLNQIIAFIGQSNVSAEELYTVTEHIRYQESYVIGDKEGLTNETLKEMLIKYAPKPQRVSVNLKPRFDAESDTIQKLNAEMLMLVNNINTMNLDLQKRRAFLLSNIQLVEPTSSIPKLFAELEKINQEAIGLRIRIYNNEYQYLSFIAENKNNMVDSYKLLDSLSRLNYKMLKNNLDSLSHAVDFKSIQQILDNLIILENNASRSYRSLPFTLANSKNFIELSITPRDSKSLLQTYRQKITIPPYNPTYAGVGASFYFSTLYNESYSTQKVAINDSTTGYLLKAENFARSEAGISTMLRIGRKFGEYDNLGLHLAVGPGLSLGNTLSPRVLAGAGFTLGSPHMLALDIGGLAGYTEVLSSVYEKEQVYKEQPQNVTVSRFQWGWFGSIGYVYKF